MIILINKRLKVGDIQSGPPAATIWRSPAGRGVGRRLTCGLEQKNDCILYLDN